MEYPGASEDSANRAAVDAARALSGRPGFLDAVPGARTLFLTVGSELDRASLERELSRFGLSPHVTSARTVRIPVHYGGAAALDIEELARGIGVSPQEVARRHAAASYRVAFLGFAPGFGYCVGLPEELHAARLSTPRPRVAGGTLAVGASYTGVYPADTPGGWRLIGRSPARFFDPEGDPPTLLLPGDNVVFDPEGPEEGPSFSSPVRQGADTGSDSAATPVFRIRQPGLFTSLQGAPGYGRGAFGVPSGGAMDQAALAAGNALVENAASAAALEVTLVGPELEVLSDCRASIAGAAMEAEWNGSAVPRERPFDLRRGDRLRLSRATSGVRAYLCVAGGLAVPETQWQTLRLSKDDVIARASAIVRAAADRDGQPAPRSSDGAVRVRLGPQEDRFGPDSIAVFLSQAWRVSSSSDRRGVRLEGDPIRHAGSAEIAPEGTAPGAIQVPADGRPIVLGPDRPVTGGYAKIATVLAEDLPLVAQAGPGALLRFQSVSPA